MESHGPKQGKSSTESQDTRTDRATQAADGPTAGQERQGISAEKLLQALGREKDRILAGSVGIVHAHEQMQRVGKGLPESIGSSGVRCKTREKGVPRLACPTVLSARLDKPSVAPTTDWHLIHRRKSLSIPRPTDQRTSAAPRSPGGGALSVVFVGAEIAGGAT
jgi:hypothetical protein